VWLIGSAAWLMCCAAVCRAYVWFGPQDGPNGVRIVCHDMNRDRVTIGPGTNAIIAAVQLVDDKMSYDVTDTAQWSGLRVVPRGPYRGYLLASHTGAFTLAVAHTAGGNTFRDSIAVAVTMPNDADNDGMLDAWEEAHGLDPSRNDAPEDPDGDGVSNLHEFWNGTHPGVWQEVFAFPPLHRYPYSNGCYCAPDVNLEWFASTTLGRYEVEAAVWPGCEALVYRGTVWDTNAIGDAIVHTADLSAGMGTQVAFRVRAAFTNESGWTAWSGWRPFAVLEPLEDHTLRLASGEPMRAAYFFFWDYETNALVQKWNSRGYASTAISNALAALAERDDPLHWQSDDSVCTADLAFLRTELNVNTVLLDQWASACFRGGIATTNVAPDGRPPDYRYLYDFTHWSPYFTRDNRLCKSQGIQHLPWLSLNEHWGIAQTHASTDDKTNQQIYAYLQARYNTGPLELTTGRRWNTKYQDRIMGDITGTNYQAAWCAFVNEYIAQYAESTNAAGNSLVHVRWRGKSVPVVAPIVELSMNYVRDFGADALAGFREWLARRYGSVRYLNRAWGSDYEGFEDVTPYVHVVEASGTNRIDHPLFAWDVRRERLVRPCDDYDECIIERFVAGWRRVREMISQQRDVCVAIEHAAPFYSVIGRTPPTMSQVPYHRLSDFADVIVQRHGFDVDSARTTAMYAEWRKAGKCVVFAPAPVQNFEDHPSIQRHYTRSAFAAGANAGLYSWNELWDLTGMVLKPGSATGAHRFFRSVDGRERSLLTNGSFETGHGHYVPGWTATLPTQVELHDVYSIDGLRSLALAGVARVTLKAQPVFCRPDAPHMLLMYVRLRGLAQDEAATITVKIGNASARRMTVPAERYGSESQARDAEELWRDLWADRDMPMDAAARWSGHTGNWIPLCEYYAPGELSGSVVLELHIEAPEGAGICLDRVSFIPIY